jgi:membrane-bound lytic murein transglycosylase D
MLLTLHRPAGVSLSILAATLLCACATPSSMITSRAMPSPRAAEPNHELPAAHTMPVAAPGARDLVVRDVHGAVVAAPTGPGRRNITGDGADPAELPDLWARLRAGFTLPELEDPAVERFARRFAADRWLERIAPRARLYLYRLVTEAEERGLPAELALLPIIESGLNPQAQSPAQAAGLCQFIPATGRRFGLVQSHLADRRRDLACVGAMYDYLAQNAARFDGDWFLALAAYNWGEGAVERARSRNARRGLPQNYLSLRMPGETRAYVPQLMALRRLIEAPERFGVTLPALANRPTIDCEVAIPGDMDVALATKLAGISADEFRQLNAGIRRALIPKATHPTLCLSFEAAVRFQVRLADHAGPLATLTAHSVASRTTVIALAKRYRTTPEAIRAANDLPAGQRLRAGATVLVPRGRDAEDISPAVAMHAKLLYEPETPPLRKVVVSVRRHDTLNRIARRHAVGMADLRRWNPSLHEPLRAGQKLEIHVPAKKGTPKRGATRSVRTTHGTRT